MGSFFPERPCFFAQASRALLRGRKMELSPGRSEREAWVFPRKREGRKRLARATTAKAPPRPQAAVLRKARRLDVPGHVGCCRSDTRFPLKLKPSANIQGLSILQLISPAASLRAG